MMREMGEGGAFGGKARVTELVKKFEMVAATTTTITSSMSKSVSTVSQKKEECDDRVPSIYVRTTTKSLTAAAWFLLKTEGPPEHGLTLSPVFTEEPVVLRGYSGCAAVGSNIYLMGAHDPLPYRKYTPEQLSDVYWIDTSHPELGWNKLGSSLNHPRTSAHVVVDGKRLYAMGCCFPDDTREPYPFEAELKPEVYVVSDGSGDGDGGGSWHVLKDPLIGPNGAVDVPGRMDGHAVLDLEDDGGKKKRRIVVMRSFGYDQLYSYDVDADSWDVYHNHFQPWTYASAFVDGILYYMDHDHPGAMFGLDLNKPNNQPKKVVLKWNFKENKNRRWVPQDIPGPSPYDGMPPPEPFLVSLGSGKLAALWIEEGSGVPDHISVYYSIIKMSQEPDCDGRVNFVANPLSSSSYHLRACSIFDCLAVFPRETRQGTLENATTAAAQGKQ